MYIRRKVFSSFIDENGEERYFSTTEFEDERLYSIHPITGEIITPKQYKEVMDQIAKEHGRRSARDLKGFNAKAREDFLREDREKYAKQQEVEAGKRAAQKAERRANQATYEELAKKEAAKKRAAEKAARKEAYEKSLRGKTDKAAGWVKKAWNGEVGKLGKTGNRIAMIGTPIAAAGLTYGGIKGAQAIKNKRAALADED